MLHLAAPSRDSWLAEALGSLDEVILDHAHCEKKAASTAINLMFRYAHFPELMLPLSALAREELDHYEQVLGVLTERGVVAGRLEPSAYAARLHAAVRKPEPGRLLDTLICCALIEARSCERMTLLARGLEDSEPELAAFYRSLLACEARHFGTYLDLARLRFTEEEVRQRLGILAAHEAAVLEEPSPAVRLHT